MSCRLAVLMGVLLSPFMAQAGARSGVTASLLSEGRKNHLYSVSCSETGRQLAIAYYAVADNSSSREKIKLKTGEAAVCPSVGVYEGCYHFPSMEVALDWVRREVR